MADEFEQYLDQLTDKVRRDVGDAIKQQALMLSDAQRQALQSMQEAPADSGDLEKSCTVVPGENDLEWIVQAGGELTTREVRQGSGVDYDYALAFEYGTSRQHARPFFWPTYRERKDDMQQAINDAIQKAINE